MDERLRKLEREYMAAPSADTLFALINLYPRQMSIPDADIALLSLLNKGKSFRLRSRYGGLPHPLLSREQLQASYDMGYDAGVYFVVKGPTSPVEAVLAALQSDNINNVNQVNYLDTVDNIDVGPGNSYARSVLANGQERWEANTQIMREALTISDWSEIEELLRAYYRDIYRGKKRTHYGRIFIPAWALDYCYALVVMHYSQGFSRMSVRQRSSSAVDWSSETYASRLRTNLYDAVNQRGIGTGMPREFGTNLFLSSDNITRVRRVPLRGVEFV